MSFDRHIEQHSFNPNCDWFCKAKYGIFIHYLELAVNYPHQARAQGKRTDWDTCVNEFNVKAFIEDIVQIGAGYVMFTIHQANAFMCAPNATFDRLSGAQPGEICSHRDLIDEIATALAEHDIPLMLYFTGDGPWKDPDIFSAVSGAPFDPSHHVPGDWTPLFKKNWFSIAKEYSERYGTRIAGWWIDGADACKGYNDDELLDFAEHLKAGNPDSIVTFNPGGDMLPPWRYTVADDYTAGESAAFDDYPEGQWKDGAQWHVLSYTRFLLKKHEDNQEKATKELIEYVKTVNEKQGVVTIDVSVCRDGSLMKSELEVLKSLKTAIRG